MAALISWAWLARAGRWIAGSRIVQALFGAGFVLGWLKLKLMRARRQGRETERREAEQQAREHRAEHEGDIHAARQKTREQQKERRDSEQNENPRDRFGRDPWQ